jgi:hypothetical protein
MPTHPLIGYNPLAAKVLVEQLGRLTVHGYFSEGDRIEDTP